MYENVWFRVRKMIDKCQWLFLSSLADVHGLSSRVGIHPGSQTSAVCSRCLNCSSDLPVWNHSWNVDVMILYTECSNTYSHWEKKRRNNAVMTIKTKSCVLWSSLHSFYCSLPSGYVLIYFSHATSNNWFQESPYLDIIVIDIKLYKHKAVPSGSRN